ncbi:MAG: recombinase family protein [Flavobacterium sp.]|nr:MAG: recombinase family protein [Flavobacterium sp.]
MKVKYVRWSTLQQKPSRQLLDANSFDKVLAEQASGTVPFAERSKGKELLALITNRKVTELYVEELSRLGRNTRDILHTLDICEDNGVCVHVQNMGICSLVNGKPNTTFKMFSHLMSVIAEQEKENILERTTFGRIAARNRAVVFGRKVGTHENKAEFLKKDKSKAILKYLDGIHSIREVAKLTDTSAATVQKVKKIAAELQLL